MYLSLHFEQLESILVTFEGLNVKGYLKKLPSWH